MSRCLVSMKKVSLTVVFIKTSRLIMSDIRFELLDLENLDPLSSRGSLGIVQCFPKLTNGNDYTYEIAPYKTLLSVEGIMRRIEGRRIDRPPSHIDDRSNSARNHV